MPLFLAYAIEVSKIPLTRASIVVENILPKNMNIKIPSADIGGSSKALYRYSQQFIFVAFYLQQDYAVKFNLF